MSSSGRRPSVGLRGGVVGSGLPMWTGWTGGGLIQAGVQQPLFGSPLNKCIPGDLSPLIILLRDVTRKLSQRTEHGAWPALCALPVVEEETPNSPSTPQSDSLFSVLEVILHSLQGRGDEVSKKQKAFFYISQALAPFLNQFPDDPKNLTNKVLQAIEVKLDLSPEVLYKITAQAGHAQYFQRLLERLPHPNHEAVYDLYKIAAENGHVPLLSLLEDKFANTPETEEALILNAACPALWLANACSQSKVVAHLMQYPQVREHAEGQPAERRNTSVALELMRFQLMARRQSRLRVDSRNSIDLQEEPAAKLPKRSPAASRLAQGECTEESVEPPHSPVQLRRG